MTDGPPPPPPPPVDHRRPSGGPATSEEGPGGAGPSVVDSVGDEGGGRRFRLTIAALFVVVIAVIVAGVALVLPGGDGGGLTDGDAPTEAASHTPVTRALQDVLQEIDASERAMLQFQLTVARAAESQGDDAAEVVEAARTTVERLEEIRGQLSSQELGADRLQPARATREAYLAHLDAWVEHLEAVTEDPSLAGGEAPRSAYEDINATAAEFAEQLRRAVPEDAPPDLEALAALILGRGFERGSDSTAPGELVGSPV